MQKTKRDSNFELLRIIAILFVIIGHFNIHGNIVPTNYSGFSINWFLHDIFSLGCIADSIFIIISGYFLIKSRINYKKIIALLLEMIFYSINIPLILNFTNVMKVGLLEFIKAFLPIFFGNWFLIYYIILYIFSPFLQRIALNMDKNTLKKLIITMFVVFSFIPTLTNNAWGISNHGIFIMDFLIGAYLRLYFENRAINKKTVIAVLIAIWSVLILSNITIYTLGLLLNNEKLVISSNHFYYSIFSIFTQIIGLLLVLLFSKIRIKSNDFINSIASSTLGIYLIHDNQFLRKVIWNIILPNVSFINSKLFILVMFLKTFIIFISCVIIDKLRIWIFGKIEKNMSNMIYDIIVKIFNKLKNKFSKKGGNIHE